MVFRILKTMERFSKPKVADSVEGAKVIPLHNINYYPSENFLKLVLLGQVVWRVFKNLKKKRFLSPVSMALLRHLERQDESYKLCKYRNEGV